MSLDSLTAYRIAVGTVALALEKAPRMTFKQALVLVNGLSSACMDIGIELARNVIAERCQECWRKGGK